MNLTEFQKDSLNVSIILLKLSLTLIIKRPENSLDYYY